MNYFIKKLYGRTIWHHYYGCSAHVLCSCGDGCGCRSTMWLWRWVWVQMYVSVLEELNIIITVLWHCCWRLQTEWRHQRGLWRTVNSRTKVVLELLFEEVRLGQRNRIYECYMIKTHEVHIMKGFRNRCLSVYSSLRRSSYVREVFVDFSRLLCSY